MIDDLKRIEDLIFKVKGHKIKNLTKDKESEEYFGYDFQIDSLNIKFRISKITPKKVGQFVTLWKRNAENQIEPFRSDAIFDFYIVVAKQKDKFGFFLFPENVLSQKQILTTNQKKGKLGFRVYPNWTKTQTNQAKNTQLWQTEYFVDLTNNNLSEIEKCKSIFNG